MSYGLESGAQDGIIIGACRSMTAYDIYDTRFNAFTNLRFNDFVETAPIASVYRTRDEANRVIQAKIRRPSSEVHLQSWPQLKNSAAVSHISERDIVACLTLQWNN